MGTIDEAATAQAAALRALREAATGRPEWSGACMPHLGPLAQRFLATLFPHYRGTAEVRARDIAEFVMCLREEAQRTGEAGEPATAPWVESVVEAVPRLGETLQADAEAALAWDPAAKSLDEVVMAYPGFFAIALHRLAHEVLRAGAPLLARLLAEHAHGRTGIDIHPGATIGPRFVIDHGTGVVIGETTQIGAGVTVYQGVTIGALSVRKKDQGKKRHPTLEDGVVVYANATILGGHTVIGKGSVIGGGALVTRSVPAGSVVTRTCDEPGAGEA